jgi:predicted enzyme related to lactoylglutathione lyase
LDDIDPHAKLLRVTCSKGNEMTLANHTPTSFLPTTDYARARAFFEGVLGLPWREDSPNASVYGLQGGSLRVTKVEAFEPQPFTVLGWQVNDIQATVKELTSKGAKFVRYESLEQDDLGIWTTAGARVAWFKDPDGNTLSVTQMG